MLVHVYLLPRSQDPHLKTVISNIEIENIDDDDDDDDDDDEFLEVKKNKFWSPFTYDLHVLAYISIYRIKNS